MKTIIAKMDDETQRLLRRKLSARDYQVLELPPERDVLETIGRMEPDLVILPAEELVLCSSLRQRWPALSIVFFGPNAKTRLIVQALDDGADEYVVYPGAPDEFAARIRAKLRMASRGIVWKKPEVLTSRDGTIVLHVPLREVRVNGRPVRLTSNECALLELLMTNAERVISHRQLLQQVWGADYAQEFEYLRVCICHLRCKVEADPSHPRALLTEPSIGYVFRNPEAG